MTTSPGPAPQIALASMPWPMLNRPSIQLGALKAYVEQHTSCTVATFHPYLQIAKALGTETYTAIAESSWAGESLFAALLFPERYAGARKTFTESLAATHSPLPDFDLQLDRLQDSCQAWLDSISWPSYQLAGFSLCFNQLFASLYIAAQLHAREDSPPIVFGGSACGGELGRSLFATFPQIEYLIDGEGETPLAGLCRFLGGAAEGFPDRVLSRRLHTDTAAAPEVADLNRLPHPDYAPYFQEIKQLFPDAPFIPVLPVEFSRGCWWNRCAFCNLNLQWCGYRQKRHDTMLAEIDTLTSRHQCLDYTFTDNALPPNAANAFFAAMAESSVDHRFFAEIRSLVKPGQLEQYRLGGLDTIQVGIEALSSSLLARMHKGTTAIDNISMLKHAQAGTLRLEGNLIMEFPGATKTEVDETLENLDYVLPFHPLAAATFFLGHDSPMDRNPHDYAISAITQHHRNSRLFPARILRNLTLLVKDYRGDRQQQRILWRPVRKKIAAWQDFHRNRPARHLPALSYRDGGNFLIIRQEIAAAATLRHRLQGLSRAIYLFCDDIRTLAEISHHFASLKETAILAFIHQLCRKRLMFREQDRVIALAVRQK